MVKKRALQIIFGSILVMSLYSQVKYRYRDWQAVSDKVNKMVSLVNLEYQFLCWAYEAMDDDNVSVEEYRKLFEEKMQYIEMVRCQL